MSKIQSLKVVCPQCKTVDDFDVVLSINVGVSPELREKLLKNEINKFLCNNCGYSNIIDREVMYHDMGREFVVWFGPNGISNETIKTRDNSPSYFPDYFRNALLANNLFEAVILIKTCEVDGAPKNITERESMQEYVRKMIEVFNENKEEISLSNKQKPDFEIKCKCDDVECSKCLSVNCQDKECSIHTKEAKIGWRKRWELANGKPFPKEDNF